MPAPKRAAQRARGLSRAEQPDALRSLSPAWCIRCSALAGVREAAQPLRAWAPEQAAAQVEELAARSPQSRSSVTGRSAARAQAPEQAEAQVEELAAESPRWRNPATARSAAAPGLS